MWNHFTFYDGSNPYITMNNKAFFRMLCAFDIEQIGGHSFYVHGRRKPYKRTYKAISDIIRDFAIEWQYKFSELNYSWSDIAEWGDFFTEYGKRYGLMREFHENGIC